MRRRDRRDKRAKIKRKLYDPEANRIRGHYLAMMRSGVSKERAAQIAQAPPETDKPLRFDPVEADELMEKAEDLPWPKLKSLAAGLTDKPIWSRVDAMQAIANRKK